MSISDESFPDDDLYTTKIDCKYNTSSCLSSSTPNDRHTSASTSGQSSSGHSRETTQSDPVKATDNREEEEDYTHKVRSYQDLHSVYTKRRFPHVKSKVREFIESQRAEEEQRKSTREYLRRLADSEIKDVTNNELDCEVGNPEQPEDGPSDDITRFMVEKERESLCQKALIESLQESLKEKRIEATRLRKNMDCLRVELMNAKDKVKRHSLQGVGMEYRASQSRPRLSLPTLVYMQQRTTTATQTDFDEEDALQTTDDNNNSIVLYDQKIVATVHPLSLMNYSTDHLRHIQRQIRHRSNSNPPTPTAEHSPPNRPESVPSDSAIDTEEGDSSSESVLREQFMLFEKTLSNDTTNFSQSIQTKKKRSFRRKFKWIFGPCGKCSDNQRNNGSIGEQYSQTPLLDSMTFEHKLRIADNNSP
ncbi:protein swallow [Eupeodes corollae]|uniref:protein swallow n=1 Tax=Eupeodes corollae TaxID=290404 RepID=UPI002491022C|nr:protein swallow [Eupeodes corollae]